MRISDWSSDVCSSDLFGAAVRDAQARRRQWLIAQGFAVETNGAVRYRSDMLPALQRRELLRNAGQLSDELGMGFVETCPGEQIEGVLRRDRKSVESGKRVLVRVELVGRRIIKNKKKEYKKI